MMNALKRKFMIKFFSDPDELGPFYAFTFAGVRRKIYKMYKISKHTRDFHIWEILQ